jgi:hypothetical protein
MRRMLPLSGMKGVLAGPGALSRNAPVRINKTLSDCMRIFNRSFATLSTSSRNRNELGLIQYFFVIVPAHCLEGLGSQGYNNNFVP